MTKDRVELDDLAKEKPEKFAELKTRWDSWANRVGVVDAKVHKAARNEYNNRRNEARKKNADADAAPPEGKMNVPANSSSPKVSIPRPSPSAGATKPISRCAAAASNAPKSIPPRPSACS